MPEARSSFSAPTGLLVLFLLGLAYSVGGVAGVCSGQVVVNERAGYIALDGAIETSNIIFNELPQLPREPHESIQGSGTIDCTWVIWPKPSEFSDPPETSPLESQRVVTVYLDKLLLGVSDSLTIVAVGNTTNTTVYQANGAISSVPTEPVVSDPGYPLVVRFQSTSTGAKNLGAYFQAGGCLLGIQRFVTTSGWFTDGSGDSAPYIERSYCAFLIGGIAGKVVELSITGALENNYDFIEVRDGPDISSPLVALYTGALNQTITSTASYLFVLFKSDKTVIDSGFKATFAVIDSASCSGMTTLSDSSKYFADGSSNNNYMNNLDCEWWINPEVKVGQVSLFFSEFDLAAGDYVAIYSSTNGTKETELARYTGSTLPDPVIHQGDEIVVLFHTDSSETAQGWSAVYHSGSCLAMAKALGPREGTFTDGSGSVDYKNSRSCFWLLDLSADPDIERIDFDFDRFDLEYRFDQVVIYDGSSTNSPTVATFTGNTDNITGYSTSKPVMLITFQTDLSTAGQGWSLNYRAVNYASSSSNDWIIAVVTVAVTVPALVIIAILCLIAFALWLRYRNTQRETLVEPDYYHLISTSTIEPVLYVNSDASLPRVANDANALAKFTNLVLIPDFALALILGAKKSHVEVDAVRMSRLVMLTYIYYAKPLAILQAQMSRELRKATSKTLFREDTALTTMFKVWSKIEAMPYLWQNFAHILHEIRSLAAGTKVTKAHDRESGGDIVMHNLEVDPRRLTSDDNQLLNALQLEIVVQKILLKLFSTVSSFPRELRQFFHILRKEIRKAFPRKAKQMYRIAAGNFLFLRLFCPALVDAYEYGLLERQPDAATLRVLVLISKVIQGALTGSTFREGYMQNINTFAAQNIDHLNKYLSDIARIDEESESDKSSEDPSLTDESENLEERDIIVRPEDLEMGLEIDGDIESGTSDNAKSLKMIDLDGLPEILRPHRKSLRVNRKKAIMILCAFAVEVAHDVLDSLAQLMPGQKKAKKIEIEFREVLAAVADRDYYSTEETTADESEEASIQSHRSSQIVPLTP